MVFAGDFENGREGGGVGIDSVPYPVGDLSFSSVCLPNHRRQLKALGQTDVLVYQDNANVFSLREVVEGGLDGCSLRLAINHEEVLLCVGAGGDVL